MAAAGCSTTARAMGRSAKCCARGKRSWCVSSCWIPVIPNRLAQGRPTPPCAASSRWRPTSRFHTSFQYGFGLERIVAKGTTIAVNYLGTRGIDLFRSHDVNAPPPPLYLSRPDPVFGQIRQIESTGRQTAQSLQLIGRGRLAPRVKGSVQYTFAKARNDTNGINALPANNYDLASEWGRAGFDQRHKLEALLQLKAGDWADFGMAVSLGSGRPVLAPDRPRRFSHRTDERPSFGRRAQYAAGAGAGEGRSPVVPRVRARRRARGTMRRHGRSAWTRSTSQSRQLRRVYRHDHVAVLRPGDCRVAGAAHSAVGGVPLLS